jgi:hypothetical protein
MADAKELTYEVVKHLGKLEHGHPKFNSMNNYTVDIVKWNDGAPRLEVRDTYVDKDGNLRTGTGIKLSNAEAKEMAIILAKYLKSEDTKLVIDDYDAPAPKEKSAKAKALEAAEAEAAKLKEELAAMEAKQAENDKRLAAMEALMAKASPPESPTAPIGEETQAEAVA